MKWVTTSWTHSTMLWLQARVIHKMRKNSTEKAYRSNRAWHDKIILKNCFLLSLLSSKTLTGIGNKTIKGTEYWFYKMGPWNRLKLRFMGYFNSFKFLRSVWMLRTIKLYHGSVQSWRYCYWWTILDRSVTP